MKKSFVLLFGLAAVSQVYAAGTDICGAQTSAGNATAAVAAGTGNFVVTAFTPKCSANTYVAYEQNATVFAVGSASSKGKTVFKGSTNGGGVTASGSCAASPCLASDATGVTAAFLSASTGTGGGTTTTTTTTTPP